MALITSGALLIGVAAIDAQKWVAVLKKQKISSEIIGEVLPKRLAIQSRAKLSAFKQSRKVAKVIIASLLRRDDWNDRMHSVGLKSSIG